MVERSTRLWRGRLCVHLPSADSFPLFSVQFGGGQSKPEFTVDLRGGSVEWASKDKSSKKNVLEVSLILCLADKRKKKCQMQQKSIRCSFRNGNERNTEY